MNNHGGDARPARFPGRVVLGSDGIGASMLDEFQIAYLCHRVDDRDASPASAWSWLENGRDLVPEAAKDEVTWSYPVMEPWHLAFTPGVRPIRVVVDGEVVLADGRPTRVDPAEIRAKAAEQAVRLHGLL